MKNVSSEKSTNVSPIMIATPRGPRRIGPGQPCFIIAEMSANHEQDFAKAVAIIKAAAAAGADAIKLQTYTPDTITLDSDKEWFISRTFFFTSSRTFLRAIALSSANFGLPPSLLVERSSQAA